MAASIEVQGLEQVISRIKSLPEEAKKQVLTDVSDYALTVLREPAPQRYVTRRAAYGASFQSDKQRRWFFASLAKGSLVVPYRRTGAMMNSWSASVSAAEVRFTNSHPAAGFVIGEHQARQPQLVGWKKAVDVMKGQLSFQSSRFRNVVMTAYQRAIRRLSLG